MTRIQQIGIVTALLWLGGCAAQTDDATDKDIGEIQSCGKGCITTTITDLDGKPHVDFFVSMVVYKRVAYSGSGADSGFGYDATNPIATVNDVVDEDGKVTLQIPHEVLPESPAYLIQVFETEPTEESHVPLYVESVIPDIDNGSVVNLSFENGGCAAEENGTCFFRADVTDQNGLPANQFAMVSTEESFNLCMLMPLHGETGTLGTLMDENGVCDFSQAPRNEAATAFGPTAAPHIFFAMEMPCHPSEDSCWEQFWHGGGITDWITTVDLVNPTSDWRTQVTIGEDELLAI